MLACDSCRCEPPLVHALPGGPPGPFMVRCRRCGNQMDRAHAEQAGEDYKNGVGRLPPRRRVA